MAELMTLHRSKWHMGQVKVRNRKWSAFIANPFGFVKHLLGKKCSGHLTCSKEELDYHLHNTYSDLGECRALTEPTRPTTDININNGRSGPGFRKGLSLEAPISVSPFALAMKMLVKSAEYVITEHHWQDADGSFRV